MCTCIYSQVVPNVSRILWNPVCFWYLSISSADLITMHLCENSSRVSPHRSLKPEDKRALEGKHGAKGWSERMRLSGSYFASRARAIMAAAMGAEAEVPVWLSVQRCLRSVVICKKRRQSVVGREMKRNHRKGAKRRQGEGKRWNLRNTDYKEEEEKTIREEKEDEKVTVMAGREGVR